MSISNHAPRVAPTGRSAHDAVGRAAWLGAAAAVAYALLLAAAAQRGAWLLTEAGRPQARDFAAFWLAGRMAAHGQAVAVYDVAQFRHALSTLLDRQGVNLPFVYPPVFLLFLEPLGRAPFLVAAVLWIGAGLIAYLAMARALLGRWAALPLALAAPGVLASVAAGQNGLFSAAILGVTLVLLPRRPLIAGLVLGFLAYKPQLALAAAVALVAAGEWRAIGAAALSATSLMAWSLARFASAATAFLHASASAESRLRGAGTPLLKLQSVYGALRATGLAWESAMAIHLAVALAVSGLLTLQWRSRTPYALKAAGMAVATLVLTPYGFIYDTTILGVAALFLLRDSLRTPFNRVEVLLFVLGALGPLTFLLATFAVTPWACASLTALIAIRCASARTNDSDLTPERRSLRHCSSTSPKTPPRSTAIFRMPPWTTDFWFRSCSSCSLAR